MSYASVEDEMSGPSGFAFGHRAFELNAFLDGMPLPGLEFSKLVTVTIHYSDADVAGLDEGQLTYWDSAAWTDDGIEMVARNPEENYVVFTIMHLSDFGLFASQGFEIYLPLIQK
jgi:hypothetical protein